MHTKSIEPWVHDHAFGQESVQAGEKRVWAVIALTAAAMLLEIGAGLAFGSMALLADGLHMASHASALGVSAFAYRYTRWHARDARFNFGTGKVNFLAAFASAMLLTIFAVIMAWESVKRMLTPISIEFNRSILVAVLGLAVNGVSLIIFKGQDHTHEKNERSHQCHHGHKDHNLWSAYLHVLADALTSLLAIAALAAGKYLGLMWMDPLMGILGALLVSRWSWKLIRSSSQVLLDMRAPQQTHQVIRESIEREGDNRITDLHVWAVGTNIFAASIALVSSNPQDPDHYLKLLPQDLNLVHVTVAVHKCLF